MSPHSLRRSHTECRPDRGRPYVIVLGADDDGRIEVQFPDGSRYLVERVPAALCRALRHSQHSKGCIYNRRIRARYPHTRLN